MASETDNVTVKKFTFTLSTPSGDLPPLSVAVQDLPTRLDELVPLMQEICNKSVDLAVKRLGKGERITCRKGCGHCCRQVVPLSVPEMLFLTDYIASMEENRRAALARRFSAAAKRLKAEGIIDDLLNAPSDQAALEAAERYFRKWIVCPFLEDDTCSIHAVRPFACREFNATTPPALCNDPFKNSVGRVTVTPKMTSVMARLTARVLGEKPVLLPHILLTDRAALKACWSDAFPGIALFQRLLQCFS